MSRAENGQRELGAQNGYRLAKALETSADYLLTGEHTEADARLLDNKIKHLTNRQHQYLEELKDISVKMCEEGAV